MAVFESKEIKDLIDIIQKISSTGSLTFKETESEVESALTNVLNRRIANIPELVGLPSSSNILYVGSEIYGQEGVYTSIQSAIDAASSGDTIYVFSGIYDETLVLKDGVNLMGIGLPTIRQKDTSSGYDFISDEGIDVKCDIVGFKIQVLDHVGTGQIVLLRLTGSGTEVFADCVFEGDGLALRTGNQVLRAGRFENGAKTVINVRQGSKITFSGQGRGFMCKKGATAFVNTTECEEFSTTYGHIVEVDSSNSQVYLRGNIVRSNQRSVLEVEDVAGAGQRIVMDVQEAYGYVSIIEFQTNGECNVKVTADKLESVGPTVLFGNTSARRVLDIFGSRILNKFIKAGTGGELVNFAGTGNVDLNINNCVLIASGATLDNNGATEDKYLSVFNTVANKDWTADANLIDKVNGLTVNADTEWHERQREFIRYKWTNGQASTAGGSHTTRRLDLTSEKYINGYLLVDGSTVPPTEVDGDIYILDDTGAINAAWDGAAVGDIVEFQTDTWVKIGEVVDATAYTPTVYSVLDERIYRHPDSDTDLINIPTITQAAFLALSDTEAEDRYVAFYQWGQRNISAEMNFLDVSGAILAGLAVNGTYVQKVSSQAGESAWE